jgi:hypothetical protein
MRFSQKQKCILGARINPCEKRGSSRTRANATPPSRIPAAHLAAARSTAARESRHHKGVKRTDSSPLPPPIPISTFFAMLGWDDIEAAAKTPITAAVMIMRT